MSARIASERRADVESAQAAGMMEMVREMAPPDYRITGADTQGDRVTLQLKVEDGAISEVGLIGNGCAISQASASMMTVAVKGKSLDDAEAIKQAVRAMIVERGEPDKEVLGDLVSLEGVAKLHARVKCAMCGWSALEAALEQRTDEIDLDHDETMPGSSRGGGY